jgi:hypothetical protein
MFADVADKPTHGRAWQTAGDETGLPLALSLALPIAKDAQDQPDGKK